MSDKGMIIEHPLVIMFKDNAGGVICHIHPDKSTTYRHYGMLICDLVRHVSRAFKVSESDVWEWVDKERHNPTTDVTRLS